MQPTIKIETIEDIFKREYYEIIYPYKSNKDIFNKTDYDIEMINQEEGKLVIIRRKKLVFPK